MLKNISLFAALALVLSCHANNWANSDGKKSAANTKRTLGDETKIDTVKSYTGDIQLAGFRKGQKAPDIALYTLTGQATKISELLADKVPILLVGGSYTCPMFRGSTADVNELVSFYKDKLKIYVVYQVEAHPSDDNSPYAVYEDVPMPNIIDEINYMQPKTFGQRKAMADTLMKKMNITSGILLDGPTNDYWRLFGPAPNNAYLIDTNMVIAGKNAFLDDGGENIWCDIDNLLHVVSGKCQ